MPVLQPVYAPHPIFKQQAEPVGKIDASIQQLVEDMQDTMDAAHAVGLAAPLVGVSKRVVTLQVREGSMPGVLINPEITWASDEMHTMAEASISFPYIEADVTRPREVKVEFLDVEGRKQNWEAHGFLASLVQHEIDYLNGKIFLDYLTPMKRQMLVKKMQKQVKLHPPHIHTEHCHHH